MKRSELQRRTPLKAKTGLTPGKPLNPGKGLERSREPMKRRSNKRAAQERRYGVKAKAYLAAHPVCEAPGCNGQAVDLHHVAGRNGGRLDEERLWMALCRPCHDSCKSSPKRAEELGLTVSKLRPLSEVLEEREDGESF